MWMRRVVGVALCAKLSDAHHPPCRGRVTRNLRESLGEPHVEYSCRVECVWSAGCSRCAQCAQCIECFESLGIVAWRSSRSENSAGECQIIACRDVEVYSHRPPRARSGRACVVWVVSWFWGLFVFVASLRGLRLRRLALFVFRA